MAILRRIGKLSPKQPEVVQSQKGYTVFSYNRSRRQKLGSLKKDENSELYETMAKAGAKYITQGSGKRAFITKE
jgi:hypothetical protein